MTSRPTPQRGPATFELGPLLFICGLVAGLIAALVTERLTMTAEDRDLELVRAVRDLAVEDFVHEVDARELIDDALRGMLEGLDAHSRFYGPEEIAQINRETTGEFKGIGVIFRDPDQLPGEILFPFPGSPAARAGLEVGDRIVAIDGMAVAELGAAGLQEAIQRADAEALVVTARHFDEPERTLEIFPERIIDPTIRHARMLDDETGIGYIAITSFSHRTPGEFDEAVEYLESQGLKRLIVDLRFNPGGILDAAVQVANRFIGHGTIVATKTRDETEITSAKPQEARYSRLPLVVLVDESSASASEILAGALQDNCVAAIVGRPTYGKGTVQTLRQFSHERGIIKLTTAKYYTPSGRPIERDADDAEASGIAPDKVVEIDDRERYEVAQFLRSYSPPPSVLPEIEAWEARDQVELVIRPPKDRQLDAAVALLESNATPDDRQAHY